MIQKISPTIKTPVRSSLKNFSSKLKVLSGSSMSGWNPPRFYDKEMVIPDGLTFSEKAYYLLKGKLPKSVYERWFPNDGTHALNPGDQLVTVQRTYDGAVGSIVEPPHDIGAVANHTANEGMHDISGDDLVTGGVDVSDEGGATDLFEIWKHLSGVQ